MKHTWKPGDRALLKFSGLTCTLIKKLPFGQTANDALWWVETDDGKWKGTVSSFSFRSLNQPPEPGAQIAMF